MDTVTLQIEGMKCSKCSSRLQKVLTAIDGVENAQVSLENKTAQITFDNNICQIQQLMQAVADTGFEAKQ